MDAEFFEAMRAIYTGDAGQLRALLASDPGLATRKSSQSHPTLLAMVACEFARVTDPVESATVLIDAGAALDDPVLTAASVDARDVLRLLLDRGGALERAGWSALDEALYWVHRELAQELVSRGATARSLYRAAGLGDLPAVERFFDERGGLLAHAGPIGSPFPDTVDPGRANEGPDVLAHALINAVQNEQLETAERLLGLGADVNRIPPGYHWRGTALHAAIWRNSVAAVDWLLAHGADPSVRDLAHHGDALGWAKHHGHTALSARISGQ